MRRPLDAARHCADNRPMRTTYDSATVRLYHLSDGPEGGAANTLCYAPLAEALRVAAAQPSEMWEGLYIATDNDVIAYLDLAPDDL